MGTKKIKQPITTNTLMINHFVFITSILLLMQLSASSNSQPWIWAKSSNGNPGGIQEGGNSLATDAKGNVFVTGYFNDAFINFGGFTITNPGFSGTYLVKYDSIGNITWAKGAGVGANVFVPAGIFGSSVCTDTSGNVFLTGFFISSSIAFGTDTLTIAGSNPDIFLVKYDPNGNVLWAKSAGDSLVDQGISVSTDVSGNVFLTGFFFSPTITFGTYTLTNAGGGSDIFLAKYDPNGNLLWAKSAGGSADDIGNSVSADGSGNVFVTGSFQSPSINFGTNVLANAGGSFSDVFIAKYDPSGNVLWAKSAGGSADDIGNSVSADSNGNIFLTGGFKSPSINFGTNVLANAGGGFSDVFITKYDPNGNVLWAKSAGGSADDVGLSISVDPWKNVYLAGGFNSSGITFGTFTLLSPAIIKDPAFIVKYDSSGNVHCASALTSGGDDFLGVCADKFGNAYLEADFWVSPFIVGLDTLINTSQENAFVAKYNCNCNLATSIKETIDPCNNGSDTLAAVTTGGNNVSYLWNTGATTGSITVATSVKSISYTVIASNVQCKADTAFITVKDCFKCGEDIFVPNAFSPNGDGQNDVLYVYYNCIKTMKFKIFNRWGNKVFETDDPLQGWDGKQHSKELDPGVFCYMADVINVNGEPMRISGNVSLIR